MDLLSHKTGIPEPTLRYLVCVLASYPLSLCYRGLAAQVHQAAEAGGGGGRGGKGHVVHMSAPKQPLFLLLLSLYNAAASLAVAVFFTRGNLEELSHSLLAVIVSWVICKQRILAPGLVGALFNFLYMLLCYYRFSSDGYNVNWLLPQCVLCLRMMGLCFDVGDGRQEAGSRKAPSISIRSNPEFQPIVPESSRALESCPSLLDTIGFSFYYGSFMAGPQFPFVIYKCHINNTLTSIEPPPNQALLSSVYSYSLRCFLMGVVYVVSSEIISSVLLPSSYMLSPAFLQDSSVLFRITYITIWGKFALHKYIGIWLLVEGGLCLSGITYNGYDEKLKTMRWDGMTNVKPSVLESVGSLNDVIAGFNINTNLWSKVYIFKRLKFLGNKNLSILGTLSFLAIWHGLHVGYFLCFALEFLDLEVERKFQSWISSKLLVPSSTTSKIIFKFLAYVWTHFALSYALVPFVLLHWDPTYAVWESVGFIGHVIVAAVFGLDLVIPKSGSGKRRNQDVKIE